MKLMFLRNGLAHVLDGPRIKPICTEWRGHRRATYADLNVYPTLQKERKYVTYRTQHNCDTIFLYLKDDIWIEIAAAVDRETQGRREAGLSQERLDSWIEEKRAVLDDIDNHNAKAPRRDRRGRKSAS